VKGKKKGVKLIFKNSLGSHLRERILFGFFPEAGKKDRKVGA